MVQNLMVSAVFAIKEVVLVVLPLVLFKEERTASEVVSTEAQALANVRTIMLTPKKPEELSETVLSFTTTFVGITTTVELQCSKLFS